MSSNLNNWCGSGYLTRDPMKVKGGVRITVACNDDYTDRATGEVVDQTQFVDCVCFIGKNGSGERVVNAVLKYLREGSYVEIPAGKLCNNNFVDKKGVQQYRMNILFYRINFGPRGGGNGASTLTIEDMQEMMMRVTNMTKKQRTDALTSDSKETTTLRKQQARAELKRKVQEFENDGRTKLRNSEYDGSKDTDIQSEESHLEELADLGS